MVQVGDQFSGHISGQFSGLATVEGLQREPSTPGVIASSPQGPTPTAIRTTTSGSLPFQIEADPRALPPAPLVLGLIPLLLLFLLLALRSESPLGIWCRNSFDDFLGLFRPISKRRHVIHDKPYLDRVLRAEFEDRRPPSPVASPSAAKPPEHPPRSSAEPPDPQAIHPQTIEPQTIEPLRDPRE